MSRPTVPPTGREITFADHELIVTKTDLTGVITYANEVFLRVAGYTEDEVLGQQHNMIRHPAMPRCVFWLLWDTLKAKREIFAYVLNQAKNGDEYWVFAHVTPSFDSEGNHVGYHSNRRAPYADALPAVRSLYASLLREEQRHSNAAKGMEAGVKMLTDILAKNNTDYPRFVFSLSKLTQLETA
jgi:PAS domain S-box-containing protein